MITITIYFLKHQKNIEIEVFYAFFTQIPYFKSFCVLMDHEIKANQSERNNPLN